MSKKYIIVFSILTISLIVFISGCISQQNYEKYPVSLKNNSTNYDNNVDIKNQSVVYENESYGNENTLPICKTQTATSCRIVEGQTKKDNYKNEPYFQESKCTGNGTVQLISPINSDDIGIVIPMGMMVGGHVTPIDHMYFQPINFQSAPDTYNVYADADGIINSIQSEPNTNGENKYNKIRIIIHHTCDFYSIYNLLTSLSPDLLNITGPMNPGDSYTGFIVVKKGQLLGKIGGQTLDLSVNYDKITLTGFIVPEHYAGESWKIHTVDPFDYFTEPDKSEILAKNLRQALPRGGKIDYDIDGKLIGNWFIEGSGGYPTKYIPDVYKNHASFVYDHVDPAHIIISLGNVSGEPKQYGVKGNSPDPKDVSVSTGLVKYELAIPDYVRTNGQYWDRFAYANDLKGINQNIVQGVVLVQLISERKLKLEIFPNKTVQDVSGFTNNFLIYER